MNEAHKRFNDTYKFDRQELSASGSTVFIFDVINNVMSTSAASKIFHDFIKMLSLDDELNNYVTSLLDTGELLTYTNGQQDHPASTIPRKARVAFGDRHAATVFKLKYL